MSIVFDGRELSARVGAALNRWPTVGLAAGVVHDGALVWFQGHGVADLASRAPIVEQTVFRIASITKTMTAVAVLQLAEQGLLDLDDPVERHLRTFRLVPARPQWRSATLRHLLTHTAGVRAVRDASDLLRPALGWSVPLGRPVPPLGEYYARGLHIDVEPGTHWAYSNHGFATLGQVVEDVSGIPLDKYLHEHVFAPLGMDSTDLGSAARVRPHFATGHSLRGGTPEPVADEIVPAGGGGVFSSTADLARFAAALLGGGANAHGSVLRPETLATMFAPQYQPDPRLPCMGLAFFREEVGGHRVVSHDGIWKGYRTALLLAPDDGVGVIVMANSAYFDPRGAPVPLANALLRSLLGVPDKVIHTDVPERPWLWGELCGFYTMGPGVLTDPQPRMAFGAGFEVVVRRDHLVVRSPLPVPAALRRGLRLYPSPGDPDAFELDLSVLGLGPVPVVFGRGPGGEVTAVHTGLTPISFRKRRALRNPRHWVRGATLSGVAASALAVRLRRRNH